MTERPPVRPWFDRPVGRWADLRVVVLVGLVQVVGTYLAGSHHHQTGRKAFDALAFLLLAAGPLALMARRRAPGAVLVVVFATTLAYDIAGYPRGPIFLALIVAFFTAAFAGRRQVA